MNRVYKVIWSKAKHCYVVTSEIARSVTKSASSACSAGRKGAAVLAMAALLFTAGGVLGEAANIMDVTGSSEAKDVILVKKDDGTTTPITINDVEHAINANSDGDGLIIKENYVKNADARVSTDGEYVKKDKKVGENLSALDTQVKANKDHIDAFVPVAQQVGAKAEALGKLDQKGKDNLKVGDGGVISKVTGDDSTPSSPVNKLVLNKDGEHQITLSDKGIKVGLNSGVMDKDGFYAGGDTADTAMAALKADGKIKGANGAFTVDENGNVASKATITGETVTDGKGASMSNGTVTGKTLTDGIATITNGNINTSGSVTGGTVTSTGNISAVGDIHAGGAITGASASIQGALTAGSATITGDLTAGGAIQGKSISDGTATMQNGNITGVKNLSAETITTSGDATIGGDLTVNGQLNVDEIDLTKSGIVGDNNVTASTKVAAGEITSYKKATSTKDGSEKESAIDYDENSTSTWAKATDADGNWNKSTLTVEGSDVTSKVVDSEKNSNLFTQTSTQSQSTLTDKDNNTNVSTQTASESSSVVSGKDGEKTYKSYITQNLKEILQKIEDGDGHVLTSTEQTETDITNTAKNGTIANEAKDITNHATENMTNTVGGKLLNDVTGDMENKVGGNLITTVSGTSTETVTGKKTETYNDGLETTVTGEEKHTVNGSQTNSITGDQVNTIGGKQTTTVTGDVTEDYKANLSTTVGGSQTTTVIGDSSLTAENINNTAKNKITNKALDVETDAASSIVSKVSNDAGSNTSTQLSYQTKEEMSQADGKTASYLRGAAEEKSQLTDGAKKTTIDTVAGQTNTNITDGTNISNSLQKADQAASSVTDGTNTTVVNQDAKSLASSITDGAKANNTNSTVDKSEQLIKASDTQYSATSKTATKMEDALVSGGSVIDVIKNLDDAANTLISSAETDGTNNTGVTQTAKDITNAAQNGTITNEAKDLVNTASENMTNNVGKDLTTTVGGEMKTTVTGKVTEDYKSDLSTKVGGDETHAVTGNQTTTVSGNRTVNVKGTETENFNAQVTSIKTDQKTSVGGNQTNIVTGNQQNTVSGSKTESVKGAVSETYGSQNTKVNGDQSTTVTGKQTNSITGDQVNTIGGNQTTTVTGKVTEDYKSDLDTKVGGNQTTTVTGDSSLSAKNITNTASEKITNQIGDGSAVKSEMTANGITNTAKEGTIYNKSKDILNEASGDIINWADGEIGNVATKITNITGDNTVTSDTNGTTFENKAHNTAVKEGTVTKTTISGNTIETGQATMDYADVTKDLSVGGNATVENDLTVKGTSEFVGEAHFRYDVYVDNNLTVAKETRTDTLYVDHDGYVGGNLNVDGNIETHDAVLSADSRQVVTGRQLYQTNERVDRLDNRIKKVGANAAALAALRPGDFNPDDKFSIAAGFGSYRNANAAALGLFYRPNENVLLSLGTSFGDGENMVNAGVSVKFGRGKSMAERRKEMADEVSSMRDEMRSQDERIAELEEMLKKQSELIEKLSKES